MAKKQAKLFGGDNITPDERLQMLKDNCSGVEEMEYFHEYTPEELNDHKNRLFEVDVELHKIKLEKKKIADELRAKEKPFANEHTELLTNIKRRGEDLNEEVFKFVDDEEARVTFYNNKGETVFERPLLPAERQTDIFRLRKTGTEDTAF